MTADLLPCPFCANTDLRLSHLTGGVFCENCGCDGPWSPAFNGDWNTRAAPTLSAALALPEVAALVEALMDAESVLALSEKPAFADPQHHADVTLLGRRIGFGALMSSASASWRNDLLQTGYPAGGEYVAGPCHATVVKCLGKARAALAALEGRSNG